MSLGTTVLPEHIGWGDGDDDYGYLASDFEWKEDIVELKDLGDDSFLEYMSDYIEEEINIALGDIGMNISVNSFDEISETDSRLANLIKMLAFAKNDKIYKFDVPIQITKNTIIDDCGFRRVIIADGWHRIGVAIAAGLTKINAVVGFPKKSCHQH